jgi:hypothetical protein
MKVKKELGVNGIIVPTFIEPNGKMEKFLEVARDPKVQKEYEILLKELECKPEEFSRKLREVVWKGKSVDEIFEELGCGKSK